MTVPRLTGPEPAMPGRNARRGAEAGVSLVKPAAAGRTAIGLVPPLTAASPVRTAALLLRAVRPRQWTKNIMVLAPLVFSGSLGQPTAAARVTATLALFCALSGGVYLLNDVADGDRDRLHPVKRRRPVAAGLIAPRHAVAAAAVLLGGGLAAATALGPLVAAVAAAYLVLQLAYMLALKRLVLLDVMAVATGFVLRVVAGAVAIPVAPSAWLLLCTALLALFLALVKRRQELVDEAVVAAHRPALDEYSAALLDQLIATVTAATIVVYSVYTFLSVEGTRAPALMLTVPFVIYGLFRYLYLVHKRQCGACPDEAILGDLPLLIDLALWATVAVLVLYVFERAP